MSGVFRYNVIKSKTMVNEQLLYAESLAEITQSLFGKILIGL